MTSVKRLFIAAAILASVTASAQLKNVDIVSNNHYEKTGETCFAGISVEDRDAGLQVSEVFTRGSKTPAVFRLNDRILAIGEQKISTRKEWDKAMESFKPGTKILVQLERAGKPLSVEVELEKIDVFGRVI